MSVSKWAYTEACEGKPCPGDCDLCDMEEEEVEYISALVKRPGEIPRHVNVSNRLEALQKNVGGYIETVTIASDLVILCDEEGRLKGKPYNCTICGVDFVGDILMVGVSGTEFSDLPLPWKDMKKMFPTLWEVE